MKLDEHKLVSYNIDTNCKLSKVKQTTVENAYSMTLSADETVIVVNRITSFTRLRSDTLSRLNSFYSSLAKISSLKINIKNDYFYAING